MSHSGSFAVSACISLHRGQLHQQCCEKWTLVNDETQAKMARMAAAAAWGLGKCCAHASLLPPEGHVVLLAIVQIKNMSYWELVYKMGRKGITSTPYPLCMLSMHRLFLNTSMQICNLRGQANFSRTGPSWFPPCACVPNVSARLQRLLNVRPDGQTLQTSNMYLHHKKCSAGSGQRHL